MSPLLSKKTFNKTMIIKNGKIKKTIIFGSSGDIGKKLNKF